jgi:tRNA A37 threonylcarbamoyladenosine synthetase subunit TsaC/SUA5/YrdC
LDGGACGIGTESTIVDLSRTPYRILRHGAVTEKTVL